MLRLNKALVLVVALGVLGTSGCLYPGDRPSESRIIWLSLPAVGASQSDASASREKIAAEAVQLVDEVLVSQGFVKDPHPDTNRSDGFVAAYVKQDATGLRLGVLPDLYLTSSALEVHIVELGNRTGRLSPFTEKLIAVLRQQMQTRFGSRSVRVLNS